MIGSYIWYIFHVYKKGSKKMYPSLSKTGMEAFQPLKMMKKTMQTKNTLKL